MTLIQAEEKEDHQWQGGDGKDGGDGDELGRFGFVATVFDGEEAERGGSGESLNQSANHDDFGRKLHGGEEPPGDERAERELNECRNHEAPLLQNDFEIGLGKHKTDTDNGKWRSGTTDIPDGISDETGQFEISEKECHAEQDGDDVRVEDDTTKKLRGKLLFKEPDTVGEECDIKGDNKATVSEDALRAESASDNGIAEESRIVKNEGELRFAGKFGLYPMFIEDNFGDNDKGEHDQDAGEQAGKEEASGVLVISGRKSHKE